MLNSCLSSSLLLTQFVAAYIVSSSPPLRKRNQASSIPNLFPLTASDSRIAPNLIFNGSRSGLSLRPVKCYATLGQGLSYNSCINVYNDMMSFLGPILKWELSVGNRGQGVWDLPNPNLFISGRRAFLDDEDLIKSGFP